MFDSMQYYNWRPTIGDPTFMGWFTVFAYFITALLCAIYTYKLFKQYNSFKNKEFLFWLGLALIMVFLGINKQLDLQSLFTEIGRNIAKKQGWYDQRRIYQREFILAIMIGSGFILLLLFFTLWRYYSKYGLALLGLIVLITFIVVRAASFHHVEIMLDQRILGARLNWVLELTSIGLVALAALLKLIPYLKDRFKPSADYTR